MSNFDDSIKFSICSEIFDATAKINSKGMRSWDFPGTEIEPIDELLPEELFCLDQKILFAPVVNKKTGTTKPFAKSRQAEGLIDYKDNKLKIICRVTKMKKGMWYLWLRANLIFQKEQSKPSVTKKLDSRLVISHEKVAGSETDTTAEIGKDSFTGD